jgi:hypothetical protein
VPDDRLRQAIPGGDAPPALFGSGWNVGIINEESDRMALSVESVWLDALEHLPPKAVVVFTTNDPGRLSRRFRDGCECH